MPKTLGILVIVIIALSAAGFGYTKYQASQAELNKLKEDPNALAQEEIKKLVEEVGKLIVLPTDEEPTVATVSDASKVKDQAFFASAENGDKVLIYTKAKKAILYRPSEKKVIEVAPVNLGQSEQATVALYNGTTTTGLTVTIQEQLEEKFTNIDVTVRENANANDYEGTIVVDLSGSNSGLAEQIAEELDGEVGSLPTGETIPETDILVILGAE